MIYHERAKRVALLSARHSTLESEAEKSDSENGFGESSKKQPIFACFLQQFLVVNKMQFFVVNKILSNLAKITSTYLYALINFLSQTGQLVYMLVHIWYTLNRFSSHVTKKSLACVLILLFKTRALFVFLHIIIRGRLCIFYPNVLK